jgi:signal transduction histidine kinase
MKWISTWVKTAPLITSSRIRLRSYTPARMDAIDAVNPAADAKAVLVETVLDPQAAPVSGDPERLQQILWNLLCMR